MKIKVAAIQLSNYIGNFEKSFLSSERLIKKAVDAGATFVCLPELSSCGYIPNETVWDYGEKADGKTSKWACEIGKRYNIYIGAGYLECDGMDFFNSYLLASPNGRVLGNIRKLEPESYCFKASDIGSIIETPIGRVAIGICADNHRKQFWNRMKALAPDLIIMPHAWATPFCISQYTKQKDIDNAKTFVDSLGQIYADTLGVPVVFVNAIGSVPPMPGILGKLITPEYYCLQGGSSIFSPHDSPLCCENGEGYVMDEIEIGKHETRLKDEPKVYTGWLHPGSIIARKIIIPFDTMKGRQYYNQSKKRVNKAEAISRL